MSLRFRFDRTPTVQAPRPQRDTVCVRLQDGRDVDVLRVRDPRARRIRLSVNERGVRLTLPLRASLVSGERFLHEHRNWLAEQLDALDDHGAEGLRIDGTATLPLRGAELPLCWRSARYTAVTRDDAGLVFHYGPRAGEMALRRALRDFYEAEARADVARWMPSYLSGLPAPPRRVVFKRMSSQWGSLAPDAGMALDLSLVLARPSAFEYVLVHELCHLIHHDHSPAFWAQVEARCPHWREERAYFREEGRRLKAALRTLLG